MAAAGGVISAMATAKPLRRLLLLFHRAAAAFNGTASAFCDYNLRATLAADINLAELISHSL
jgi:hypothetical protein